MRHHGDVVLNSVSVGELIGRIARPVTLVTAGPSAKDYDWRQLGKSGRLIVAVNGGPAFLRERDTVADLLVVSDPDFCRDLGHHVRDAAGLPLVTDYRCAAVLHARFPEVFDGRRVALLERVNQWYGVPALPPADLERLNEAIGRPFHFGKSPGRSPLVGWSDDVHGGFFPSSTVAFVALQVIVELGATDIEIVGMDLGGGDVIYPDSRPSRLREKYEPLILPAFQLMHQVLAPRGIRMVNHSPTCPLPAGIFQSAAPQACQTTAAAPSS